MASRILLCDDDADAANTLRLLLESEGHEVSVCHAGLACIEKARTWRPQIVVVDIGLPDVSGYAVAREIRQLPFGREVMSGRLRRAHDQRHGPDAAGRARRAHPGGAALAFVDRDLHQIQVRVAHVDRADRPLRAALAHRAFDDLHVSGA